MAASYWFLMLIGRASSSIISGKISTTAQMTAVSLFAIIMLLIAILMPETVTVEFKVNEIPMKCFLIAVCGL
ncbi:MFS transporter, partial [Streptococcus danieliae]|nr:MFS transporter [Streptococcus danieliae]